MTPEQKRKRRMDCLASLMLSEVPDPNDFVGPSIFDHAMRDALNVRGVLENDPTVEDIIFVNNFNRAWARFWFERFPDNELFRQAAEVSPMEKENAEKANAQLRKRGVIPWHG